MQIVINLKEQDYRYLNTKAILDSIWKGTVLPENHGRLVDADAIKKEYSKDGNWDLHKVLDKAETILEGSDNNEHK